ncbi:3'-phosphoadenosine 5'-phosphosulfate sulfotransferase (PAPS reductase)/FAD synthetase [Cenarchaeum symbiosum A]|uniref:3'-phosphoadenosine 5'-phosphosulfate sulfotransferase (PAPS reductase)/FAD synthetase n=1 Tax=Cenarchaeum symbiosum (strain A) TaxID=414004 RepID=A0RVA7_CENSY|nr:3'-phosphoadenosine 5'-phosphosulfate sulfotransferase (PAPS reductase)/FAD synthetase [Cenarchaeum symbiosum A]
MVKQVCGISGGKDSSALAVYMRDKVPDMEYFFCDTGAELPETYAYLAKLEVVLGRKITKLNSTRSFDHYFEVFRGALPSPQMRWCTNLLKIKPLEDWLGDEEVISYVAIRADEKNRTGYVSTKPNIKTMFPFIDDGIDHAGVIKILDDAGINLPEYYKWRTRSGCYFCFFQRKAEWVGLADHHPELFKRAVAIEQKVLKDAGVAGDANFSAQGMKGSQYTWSQGETLTQLLDRRDDIMANHEKSLKKAKEKRKNVPLMDVLSDALDDDDDKTPCTVCHL